MGGTPVVNQALALQSRGYQVALVSLTTELSGDEIERIEAPDVRIFVGALRRNHGLKDLFRQETPLLLRMIRSIESDLLIANYTVEYAVAALRSGKPTMIVVHDHPLRVLVANRFHPYWVLRFLLSVWVIVRARHVVAVSRYVARFAGLLRRSPVRVVPNPLREEVFRYYSEARFEEMRRGTKPLRVLSVLSWSTMKNPKASMRAIHLFRLEHPDVEYHLVGPGLGSNEEGAHWARDNDLSGALRFHGLISNDDVIALMQKAHILVHPSREESVSMVILEAMAVGLPVIGNRACGGIKEILDNGSRGLLVDTNLPQKINDAVKEILSDLRSTIQRARRGHEHVLAHCNPEVFLRAIEKTIT